MTDAPLGGSLLAPLSHVLLTPPTSHWGSLLAPLSHVQFTPPTSPATLMSAPDDIPPISLERAALHTPLKSPRSPPLRSPMRVPLKKEALPDSTSPVCAVSGRHGPPKSPFRSPFRSPLMRAPLKKETQTDSTSPACSISHVPPKSPFRSPFRFPLIRVPPKKEALLDKAHPVISFERVAPRAPAKSLFRSPFRFPLMRPPFKKEALSDNTSDGGFSDSEDNSERKHEIRYSRSKLEHVNSLEDAVRLIRSSKRIVVISGAGISVSAGIPDFRSQHGLYTRLHSEFGLTDPEIMFTLSYFVANPQLFYSFAHEMWPGNHEPTPTHYFISLLERKNKLLRNFTQNIDDLERRAGVTRDFQCHGSFASAKCMSCKREQDIHEDVMAQRVPRCLHCCDEVRAREELSYGLIKPDIVFFGEPLPREFHKLVREDREKVDLVIVMGSSLKVHPVCGIIKHFPPHVPAILINKDLVGGADRFDVELLGYSDAIVQFLCAELGWTADLRALARKREANGSPFPSPSDSVEERPTKRPRATQEYHFVPPNRYYFRGSEERPLAKRPRLYSCTVTAEF